MNSSHIAATSGIVGNLAAIIVWISNAIAHGQWFPVDSATAIAIASVSVSILGAGSLTAWRATLGSSSPASSTETPIASSASSLGTASKP